MLVPPIRGCFKKQRGLTDRCGVEAVGRTDYDRRVTFQFSVHDIRLLIF